MLFKSRLYISFLAVVVVIAIGVGGYMIISNDNFVDSLYMTIISIYC